MPDGEERDKEPLPENDDELEGLLRPMVAHDPPLTGSEPDETEE